MSARLDLRHLAARLPARPRTRFAPSPTGVLHVGHVVNAIYTWGLARALGGEVMLRIEDHDRTRCRQAYVEAILDDLAWLGFTPGHALDGAHAWRQSEHPDGYAEALRRLRASGATLFWCACSRRQILAASGGGAGTEVAYPLTCLDRSLDERHGRSLRLGLPDTRESFVDGRLGAQEQHPRRQCGALLLRDRDGCWTYQFAVTVDDLRHGIDLVVRGEDLLPSTGRQIQLARLLGREVPAVFVHHGLACHPDGQKLSKSNRDTGVADLRRAGWSPGRVIGHAAWRVGLTTVEHPVAASDVAHLMTADP